MLDLSTAIASSAGFQNNGIRFRTARSGLHWIFKLFQRYQKTWSGISAPQKMRDVLDQAKQKEKPVDKMSKNETDAVPIAACNQRKLDQRGCAKSMSTTLDTTSSGP
jgi:hypothetical protein